MGNGASRDVETTFPLPTSTKGFLNRPYPSSFCLFSVFSNQNFTEKTVRFSKIRTQIVGVESEYTYHLTTTTAQLHHRICFGGHSDSYNLETVYTPELHDFLSNLILDIKFSTIQNT